MATNGNKNQIIEAYCWHAIIRRYEGATYAKIAKEIKEQYDVELTEHSIRRWFYVAGRLRGLYRQYADEMIALEKEEAQDFLKGNLKNAMKALALAMEKGGAPGVIAAKEFLERGLGKVPQELKGDLVKNNFIDIGSINILDLSTPDLLKLVNKIEALKLNQGNNGQATEKPNNPNSD